MLGFQWAGRVVNTTRGDGLYNFSSLSLTIETIIFPAILQTSLERYGRGVTKVCHTVTTEDLPGYMFTFDPDVYETIDGFKESKTSIRLAVFRYTADPRFFAVDGLALVPRSGKTVWKRIGYWYATRLKGASTPLLPPKEFKSLRAISEETKQTIVLV